LGAGEQRVHANTHPIPSFHQKEESLIMKQNSCTIVYIALIAGLLFLAACSADAIPRIIPPVATAVAGTTATTTPPVNETFTDAFAYCASVGTNDAPDSRYVGLRVPESVATGLLAALNTPDVPIDVLINGSSWRCMGGQVYACFVGANLPCEEKANTDGTPTQAEQDFCQQQPDADIIPAYVTGHNTIYEWRCTHGTAEAVKQVFQVDAQGYIADVWYQIEQNAP
jgi:hypothetical protein